MLTASLSAKEKEDVDAAGENAAQEERLCPMRMAVAVKTVLVMIVVATAMILQYDELLVTVEVEFEVKKEREGLSVTPPKKSFSLALFINAH